MRAYAPRFDGDVELWGLTGLLHDLDYERYPNLGDGHPRYAIRELEARGYPPELVRAVASHADFMGVPRETPMEKTLFAVDELSGFILACAYVRPEGLVGMTPKSVKKKMKQPSFAAAVSREDIRLGAEELGVDFDEHLTIVIDGSDRAARRADAGLRRVDGALLTDVGRRRRDGGRRDRAGAAGAVPAGPRRRSARARARSAALRPVARQPPRDVEPGRDRRGRGDARSGARAEGGDDHARGRRTTSARRTGSCARRSTAR